MMRRHRAVGRVAAQESGSLLHNRLFAVQEQLSEAQQRVAELSARRDALALRMWLDERRPQSEIADLLDRADRSVGGEGVTYAAVQRRLYRGREAAC